MPDEGDNPTELEGKWRVDGTWIYLKMLITGRKEEMEYMMKMGVFEVVDEKRVLRQRLQTSHVEICGPNERREMSFKIGVSRNQEGQRLR